jgi:pimeloyl-ACP methyl ester carboxylesterase
MQALGRGNDPLAFAALTRTRHEQAVTDEQLRAVRVPTLAVVGSLDGALPGVKRLEGVLPGLKVVVIEGAVHNGADPRGATRRPEFVNAIRSFLAVHR